MKVVKMASVMLIIAGALELAYGSFTYAKDTHKADLGTIELSVGDKETINVPVWTSAGAIVIGILLLFFGIKKR